MKEWYEGDLEELLAVPFAIALAFLLVGLIVVSATFVSIFEE